MTEQTKRHLRLISNNPQLTPFYVEPEQLALPYMEQYSIVLANVDQLDRYEFFDFVFSISPRWIIDIRVSPRFDRVAGTRSNAFRIFSSIGATYVDLLGQLKVSSYATTEVSPNYWGRPIFQMISETKVPHGPFLLLFERTEVLMASKGSLAQKCQAVFKTPSAPPIFECRADGEQSAIR